jgi:hypothetical protein
MWLLFLPIVWACFDYNFNECLHHNCLYCILNNTGYCISPEFYNSNSCNQSCCTSLIQNQQPDLMSWFVIIMGIIIIMTPIISLSCFLMVLSIRDCKTSYDVV